MAKQIINIGSQANDRSGDPLRTAFNKINQNFTELYTTASLDIQIPVQTGNVGKYLTTNGTELSWATVSGGGGLSITDFGLGFVDNLDAGKITTSKLYNENPNQGLNNQYTLEVTNGGVVVLPDSSIINGSTIRGVAGTGELNYTGITIGPNSNDAEKTWMWVDHANAYISTNNSANTWTFGSDGALDSPGGSFTKTTNNYLANNVTTQVVWTSTQNGISGVKLTIQVECDETGGVNYPNWETQVCEAIIAVRGYNSVSEPVMSVYGVTHTSVAPLMTFSVQRNPTTYLIEMVGTRTATASPLGGADLRIYSVETGTND